MWIVGVLKVGIRTRYPKHVTPLYALRNYAQHNNKSEDTRGNLHGDSCREILPVDYPDTWRKMDTTVLAAFLEYSLNPTWLADSDGRCIYANRELRGIAALSAAQLEDLNWLDLYRKRTDKCLPLYGRKREFIVSPIGLDSFFVPRDSERGIAVDAVGTGHIAPDGSEV